MIGRFVWLVLFLAASTSFIIVTINHFQTLFKYGTTTSLKFIHQPNLTLPAITICNYNALKRSAVLDSEWGDLLPLLLPYLTQTSFPQTTLAADLFQNLTFPDMDVQETGERWGHHIEDMLLECTWKQSYLCRPEDFEVMILTSRGHQN